MPDILFAGVPVADLDAARGWYERLLGRPPDLVPNASEVAWQLAEAGWIYVVTDAERAGRALLTLIVDDLDGLLGALAGRGLAAGPVETLGNGVRRTEIADPEGNRIAFGEVPAA
ncbi:MAG TPA: VOC family protein [Solirubrobacteraceae bacterium]|nr:VOC family protein [Solirubrobacteraceae bacterium]